MIEENLLNEIQKWDLEISHNKLIFISNRTGEGLKELLQAVSGTL
jgi:hypothetical protein